MTAAGTRSWIGLLTIVLVACQSSPARDPADPFDSLHRLAAEIAESAEIARVDEASSVPNGGAEGALHVLRLLRRAIDEEIAWADTAHPFFQAQDERFAKLALGNPDNLYLVTRIDDEAEYVIRGRRGTTADFNVQVYQGYPGIHRPMRAFGSIGLDSLVTDAEGRFEIHVGGAPRDENWIELLPGSRRILVRFTYGDWAAEEAGELTIERVGERGTRSGTVADAEAARRIAAAADYLEDALRGYAELVDQVYTGIEPNTLRPMRRLTGETGGLSNQYNGTGRYAVDDETALLVTTRPSRSRYQGFQIGTEWFEALDFVNQTTSLNTAQARLSSDGRYRFVIATRDPGVANWLDASSAPQGQILLRWQGVVGELGPEHEPTVELVRLDALADHFPDDEPAFSPAMRRAQIAERQGAVARRYGLSRR